MRVSVDSAGGQADDFDAVLNPRVARGSFGAVVSGSGRYVAFNSNAADLVQGPDTDGALDAFVHDLRSGRTEAVVIPGELVDRETYPVDISADGRFVLVVSNFHLYLQDRQRDRTTRVGADGPAGPDGIIFTARVSADGRRVAYQVSVSSGPNRVYLTDLRRGTTELVGVGPSGEPVDTAGRVALSGDGRTVAFGGFDNPRITLYVRDLRLGVTRLIASDTGGAVLTYDGSEVAYGAVRAGIPFPQVEVANTATRHVVAHPPRRENPAERGWPLPRLHRPGRRPDPVPRRSRGGPRRLPARPAHRHRRARQREPGRRAAEQRQLPPRHQRRRPHHGVRVHGLRSGARRYQRGRRHLREHISGP